MVLVIALNPWRPSAVRTALPSGTRGLDEDPPAATEPHEPETHRSLPDSEGEIGQPRGTDESDCYGVHLAGSRAACRQCFRRRRLLQPLRVLEAPRALV